MSTRKSGLVIVVLNCLCVLSLAIPLSRVFAAEARAAVATYERVVEWNIESKRKYRNPFDDVEVDVIFSKAGASWRVPAFWRGGQRWTVRFAPPSEGEYTYRLVSTDQGNPDLNGHAGVVKVTPYQGESELLKHGPLRISANKRYFEHADGTPFFWLGDTWWSGLSGRYAWADFQTITNDRVAKGFSVVQLVAGLVPPEEAVPTGPGASNEGGPVWEAGFKQINPGYFDAADRRIQYLTDAGIVPAIVGGWALGGVLEEMGPKKMKQHWRYLVARYGAYPVFWVLAGELTDPPEEIANRYSEFGKSHMARGWTDIARYVRSIDPYHHPLTAHEMTPPFDATLQDESLLDFDLIQSGHFGYSSLAVSVAQLDLHYARTTTTKPVVQGEIGYEKIGGAHLEDFQRFAFWLSMLNGAAGHTYGSVATYQANGADQPLHPIRYSFLLWREGMALPGSYQVGLGSKLLRNYEWWNFKPQPQWVVPRGTTLLEPNNQVTGFDLGSFETAYRGTCERDCTQTLEETYPAGEWKARNGSVRRPYAAGIPGQVRIVYIPATGTLVKSPALTILGLEPGVRYKTFYWEPSTGMRVELGMLERPKEGELLLRSSLASDEWERAAAPGGQLFKMPRITEQDVFASMTVSGSDAEEQRLLVRYQDENNFTAAVYMRKEKALYMIERVGGRDGPRLGEVKVPPGAAPATLKIEVREGHGAASLTSDTETVLTTPIVDLKRVARGSVGFVAGVTGRALKGQFEVRKAPKLFIDPAVNRDLVDTAGTYRGKLEGDDITVRGKRVPGWSRYARQPNILLDAYRPERVPSAGDWVLVLEATNNSLLTSHN